jgi:hypothetical protein
VLAIVGDHRQCCLLHPCVPRGSSSPGLLLLPKVLVSNFSLSAMDFPVVDLNFNLGRGVQTMISSHFGEHVNFFPDHGSKEFVLLDSVEKCKYRLSEFPIGIILQATLGGSAADFRLIQVSD